MSLGLLLTLSGALEILAGVPALISPATAETRQGTSSKPNIVII